MNKTSFYHLIISLLMNFNLILKTNLNFVSSHSNQVNYFPWMYHLAKN